VAPNPHFVAIGWPGRDRSPILATLLLAAFHDKGRTMEIPTALAEHAIALAIIAGLALPVLATRLILAFDKRAPRLALPSAAAAANRAPMRPRSLRERKLPALAAQYATAPRVAKRYAAPGLASRWKGADRVAVSA
jgi:hypothetical protein